MRPVIVCCLIRTEVENGPECVRPSEISAVFVRTPRTVRTVMGRGGLGSGAFDLRHQNIEETGSEWSVPIDSWCPKSQAPGASGDSTIFD